MDVLWSGEVAAGLAWARDRVDESGYRVTAASEQVKVSAWSVVYMIPTSDAVLWFKASRGETRYEAGLASALAGWVPSRVLTPLAVDVERGWQLLPDGGTPLRRLAANRDRRAWERFVAGYAELQRAVTPQVERMLELGVPDQRPAAMPDHFAGLLQDAAVAIAAPKRAALRALQAGYADACARLAEAGPASTVQHDDLHSNNVLPTPGGDRFFDWGDASVAHPFTSLLVALRTMAYTFDLPPGDPAVRRLRDAYLEVWGLGHDGPELVELAVWTGMVGRALAWRRALTAAGPADLAEYGDRVSGWVEELLEPPTRGGTADVTRPVLRSPR
jgi:hypothetical protein